MEREICVRVTSRIIMTVPEGVEVDHVMQEMDYDFKPTTEGVKVIDTEMRDFETMDDEVNNEKEDTSEGEKMIIVKCAAGCVNSNGEPDLFFGRFLMSETEYREADDNGNYLPYSLIDRLATREGYESKWEVCELDPAKSVMALGEWHTVPIYDKDLNEVKPEPLLWSIWFRAKEDSFWIVSGLESHQKVTLMELRNPEDGKDPDPAIVTGRMLVDVVWDQIQPELGHMMFLPYANKEED